MTGLITQKDTSFFQVWQLFGLRAAIKFLLNPKTFLDCIRLTVVAFLFVSFTGCDQKEILVQAFENPSSVDGAVVQEGTVALDEFFICALHPDNDALITLPIMFGQSLSRLEDGTFAVTSSVADEEDMPKLLIFDESLTILHEVELSINGVAIADGHPTGIAHREGYPTYIGGEREFFMVDYDQMIADGNLDNSVIRIIPDKMAIGFSRVEYAEYRGKVVLATGDGWSPDGARLRLLDPNLLAGATSSAAGLPGLWIRSYNTGDNLTQSYTWFDGELYLVGNTDGIVGWRVDRIDLETGKITQFRRFTGDSNSELEGWNILPNGEELYMTGDPDGQLWHAVPKPNAPGAVCDE